MSKAKLDIRDIGPVLSALRNFLLGRKHTLGPRWPADLAARTQPPPKLPDGVSHKHAHNYYYTRDGRREVAPPLDVTKSLIAAGSDKEPKSAATTVPYPGKVYMWDKHYN